MSFDNMKKIGRFIVIALMPMLFILGYFHFDADVSRPAPAIASSMNMTGFKASISSELVLVEGGKFKMGSNQLSELEKPAHEVEVTSFMITRNMITVEQFGYFVNTTGYKTTAETDSGSFVFNGDSWSIQKEANWRYDESGNKQTILDNKKPVLHVSWYDAERFCQWLSKISGKNFRLPTEAEWEFAAKGGNKSAGYIFSGGNDANGISWNGRNSGLKVHPVGQKKANELGLYDMSGDAWQWCSDWYGAEYYHQDTVKDPQGPVSGTEKICRGGSYLSGSGRAGDSGTFDQLNPTSRGKELPYLGAGDASFRIVLQR
jgi:formylglycine-generating enzyme required for sulfatase activity